MEITKYLIIVISVLSTCWGINNRQYENAIENIYWDQAQIPNNLKHILVTSYIMDNDIERILSFEDVIAKETKVNTSRNPFKLWQVSDGYSLIQLIYSNANELINCDYIRNEDLAKNFMLELYREIEAIKPGNITSIKGVLNINNQSSKTLIENNGDFNDYNQMWNIMPVNTTAISNTTYKNLKYITDIPSDMRYLLKFKSLKLECHKKTQLLREFVNNSDSKNNQQTSTSTEYFKRYRRDLSSFLRIPGTKWCGKGWDAKKYSDLGGYSKVDRCCRQHDKSCHFWIMGFETKYNFYNWRVNTLMHCKCDERFRTCLKMADTADANLVGKLFFNIVQTKCFVIKLEKICKKRDQNGKCEKMTLRKKAHLRDNQTF